MSEDLKNYFSFNRRERRGIIAMVILILLIFSASMFIRHLNTEKEVDFSQFEKEIDEYVVSQNKSIDQRNEQVQNEIANSDLRPSVIDPNTATEEQWKAIGITSNQYRVINNYLNKGGRFRQKEDLKKIYSITPDVYNKISPYIQITNNDTTPVASTIPVPQNVTTPSPATSNLIIEINSADSTLLQALQGIGPSFASRIVRYRNLLGGFYKKEQLLEVFGMEEERYNGFINNITINTSLIKKIEINNASANMLQQHPYIDKQLALLMVSYRNQHGKFRNMDDLRKLALANDELITKLSPYISFD